MKLTQKTYIIIEGVDGSGKTSTTRKIAHTINKKYGIKCYHTSEPHKNIHPTGDNMEDIKNYATDRIKWQQQFKNHADIVLQDRSLYSSYANNVHTPAEKEAWIHYNKEVTLPDIVIFLNTPIPLCVHHDKTADNPHTYTELRRQQRKYLEILPRDTWHVNNISNHEIGYLVDMIVDYYNHHKRVKETL